MARERGLYRRKDSRYWWINLVLPDGRRLCQSTRCVTRTDAEAFAVRLKNEALEFRQRGIPGNVVWQEAVIRYLEEFAEKNSLSDDKDHLKKLDPYLRSLSVCTLARPNSGLVNERSAFGQMCAASVTATVARRRWRLFRRFDRVCG